MSRLLISLAACHAASASVLGPGGADCVRDGGVHRERDFAPRALVVDVRADFASLAGAGLFGMAGSGGRSGDEDHLRSAEYCDPAGRPDRAVGDWGAFFCLWDRLDALRQELATATGCPLLPEMELHYVHYPPGGFYGRHVDDYNYDPQAVAPADPAVDGGRRAISFICYLTPPETPWQPADGGQLRAFAPGSAEGGEDDWEDVQPDSGSLVLFDSCRVEHEVLPTNRPRDCLIGWFHTPRSTPLSALRGGWTVSAPAAATSAPAAATPFASRRAHTRLDATTESPTDVATLQPTIRGPSLLQCSPGGVAHHRLSNRVGVPLSASFMVPLGGLARAVGRARQPVMELKPPPLALPRVAELVETTFVRSCMDLARGDVTTLKLFIAAAIGGVRLGARFPELMAALGTLTQLYYIHG